MNRKKETDRAITIGGEIGRAGAKYRKETERWRDSERRSHTETERRREMQRDAATEIERERQGDCDSGEEKE